MASPTSNAPEPSALSLLLKPNPPPEHPAYLYRLAQQILHNLQHAHYWTSLRIHSISPLPPHALLPRPLITGLPPQRVYVHPDEQASLLKSGRDANEIREWEWVLPTHLKEKWSLRRFAEVFDGIGAVPPPEEEEAQRGVVGDGDGGGEGKGEGRRKRLKRVLLATLSDDSTVVYYIVHDEIVKPRQN